MSLRFSVAPCVGAWIETLRLIGVNLMEVVAPCVGAWIETPYLPL